MLLFRKHLESLICKYTIKIVSPTKYVFQYIIKCAEEFIKFKLSSSESALTPKLLLRKQQKQLDNSNMIFSSIVEILRFQNIYEIK